MKALITGGAGFIGQALTKRLLDLDWQVVILDNFVAGIDRNKIDPRAKVVWGDVRYRDQLDKFRFVTHVFHLAAPSSIILFNKNEFDCVETTILGFVNVIDFCRRRDIKLIYPSTGSLYAGAQKPHSETTKLDLNKINSYARTKYALEVIQQGYKNSTDILGLRIFAGYGPEEAHKGEYASVVYDFVKKMKNGESPVIFGDGWQTRDFIYSEDLANIIVNLALKAKEDIVNIGSGEGIAFNHLVNAINGVLGTKIKPTYVDKPVNYLEETLCDTWLMSKYYKKPLTSIGDGIRGILKSL
jgi:nucleoside-diphosphate-sugar epimerase